MAIAKNTLLSDLQILVGLHLLPDAAALTTDEAAIFLRLSRSSMERMRRVSAGPDYVQGGGKGAKGVNQKCSYIKSDLIIYQNSNKVANSMAAAVRRGQAYMPYADPTPKRSLYDLITKRPFYRDEKGSLAGCVDETPVDTVIARLGAWEFEWLSPIHAASKVWSEQTEHVYFAKGIKVALDLAMKRIDEAIKDNP